MSDHPEVQFLHRQTRDRAIVLVIFGVAVLMPPMVGISLIPHKIAGIPVPLLYVFSIWICLIAVAFVLARRFGDTDPTVSSHDPAP
ncbi:hypothetical protein GGD81_001984 [Rhodobium orientis]|uniref:DUF3311 domain-containing protein n=1 Tax=Rhodobium orientis TaxID=34017 RepID=A0A327JS30_9HYPH|nr:hypothetical protein [Rhodobium orientis]MBB4302946.1 hypothetical protein [Rhodobium orientis]MBK5949507.1 hypothetical protein [Rhodobium orientis]RAI29299.1 hypothetical protein CH339_03160 [Rhodobium orientis]